MADKLTELMAATVAKLVTAIEEGRATGRWVMPWRIVASGLHHQAENGRPYRGSNQLVLMMTAFLDGCEDPRWATYKTWARLGAQVQKGESGTRLVKWGSFVTCDRHGKSRERCCAQAGVHLYARPFVVFNAAQVEGAPALEEPDRTWSPVEAAEKVIANSGAQVIHTVPDKAFFSPQYPERVNVPPVEAFDSAEDYYGTTFHELVHWSGHKSRLNRDMSTTFGSESYAAEELVAEIGATFVGAHCRLSVGAHMNSAEYLASWLKVLKAEPKRLYQAAKLAQEAADYLSGDSAEG